MESKKDVRSMTLEEHIQEAERYEAACARRNALRRKRRQWLKTAIYLQAERRLLRWLPDFPDLAGDAMQILLTLAHSILHLLHPDHHCSARTLADCPVFSVHQLCQTACEIGFNYRLDERFKLTQGLDRERLRFDTLLGDLQVDL